LPAGDWASGERGIACHPDRVPEFDAGVDLAVEYATTLGCRQLNCLAGKIPEDVDPADARATFVRNVGYAARRLQKAGLTLLVEPVNTRDVPGFFLTGTAQAVEILNAGGPAKPFVQFDTYHMHRMGEDLVATLRRHISHIGHIQIADSPGRHEPGTGSIDFTAFFAALDQCGYAGAIGCEYNPTGNTEDGLGWARPFLEEHKR
jgi:hydroxypyruvate isomerase